VNPALLKPDRFFTANFRAVEEDEVGVLWVPVAAAGLSHGGHHAEAGIGAMPSASFAACCARSLSTEMIHRVVAPVCENPLVTRPLDRVPSVSCSCGHTIARSLWLGKQSMQHRSACE
jgi:hypothetical protein